MPKTPNPSTPTQPGRPLKKFDLKKVEELAARGLSLKQLAIALDVNIKTIQKHKKIDNELNEAIDRGRVQGLATISNALYQNAVNGNISAQIFYLKNRASEEWKDKFENKIDIKADVTALHLAAVRQISTQTIEGETVNREKT